MLVCRTIRGWTLPQLSQQQDTPASRYATLRRRLFKDIPLAALNGSLSMRKIALTPDIAYGPRANTHIDLYAPQDMDRTTPVVVFFYGGRWHSGRRQDYRFVAHALATQGICCVLPDYRLHPEVQFPTFIHDGADALTWTAQNIDNYGGSADNIFVMGHSAGAHIAAMLALNADFRQSFDATNHTLKGFVGLSGPYDFLPMRDQDVIDAFGDKAQSLESQPIHYASANAPPSLLITSKQDIVVRPRNALRLAEALEKHGVPVEISVFPNLTHVGTLLTLAAPFRWRAPVLDQIVRFIRHHNVAVTGHD